MTEPLEQPTARSGSQAEPAQSKSKIVERLLKRSRGATVAEMSTSTGWQSHSVRAHLSGLRKKGLQLVKEDRKSGETAYRIGKPADTPNPEHG